MPDDPQLVRAVRALTTATGRLREASADVDERLSAVEALLQSHAGASQVRHEETLRRLAELGASPLRRAAEERAVEVLEGRAGLSGWLRRLPSALAAGARWATAHPIQAGVYLAGLAGVARVLSALIPGLGVVASALEAAMNALAPLTGTGGAP